MLQQLWLQSDTDMQDKEAVLLAQALPAHVTDLELRCTGMDDALASIVRTGCFQCLETLWLGSNEDVTDQGVAALAKALDHAGTNGLPLLSTFSASLRGSVTRVGVEALAHALLKNCPRLKEVALYGVDDDDDERMQQMVDEMVVAAGCRHRVRININAGTRT